MASTPKGSSRPGDPGRRKRPGPPTIELRATEVPPEPVRPEPAQPTAASTEPTSPEPPVVEGSRERERPEQASPPPGTNQSGSRPWPGAGVWAAFARHWTWPPPWPVAGAAGGAALALVVLAFLLAGPAPRREDPAATFALRLALIESELRKLGERPAAAADPRISDLASRLAAAEQAMRRLDDISARLATGEQALRRQDETGRRLEGFGARLDTMEQALAAPRPAPDAALAERVGASEAATRTLTERLAAMETATKSIGDRLAASGAGDKTLTDRLAALETAATSLGERVSDLARRLDQVRAVAREADRQATIATEEAQSRTETADRTIRTAFVAAALRNAVERGAPFADELAALKPLMAPGQLAPLEEFAATGVPSAAALVRELAALVPAMRSAIAPPSGNGGLMDRLQQSAERLVRIRPINDVPGDDSGTVIGRLEAKAARGDIDAALSEFAKLPAAARAPAADWIRKAEARRAALDIAGRLAHDAFGALGKTSP